MTTLADYGLKPRLQVLMFGAYKTAKTVNAHQMPRTRTLDFDDGMQSVLWAIKAGVLKKKPEEVIFETIREDKTGKYGRVKAATALDAATDALDLWLTEETKDESKIWDTLILDSGTSLTEFTINKGLEENARLKLSKSQDDSSLLRIMRMQDWGSASQLFRQFVQWAKSLDKNLILICHEYQDMNAEGVLTGVKPLVIGQLRDALPNMFDECWHTSVEGSRNAPKFRMQTKPDSIRKCGSRLGCFDPMEEFDFEKLKQKVADFYGVKPETLWTGRR
jgi:hypothetical protein